MIARAAGSSCVALQAVAAADFVQVVERIEIDAQAIVDRRIEIARHGQVENHDRPLLAGRLDPFEPLRG